MKKANVGEVSQWKSLRYCGLVLCNSRWRRLKVRRWPTPQATADEYEARDATSHTPGPLLSHAESGIVRPPGGSASVLGGGLLLEGDPPTRIGSSAALTSGLSPRKAGST